MSQAATCSSARIVNEIIIQRLLWLLARRSELNEDVEKVEREITYERGRLAEAQRQSTRETPERAAAAAAAPAPATDSAA